ncbi:CU044_5270 family protein [Actinoplanes friuliensis]|uniref:Uncharacterized protein n=1 Tax=Actinoplanes friuliensis DSM 7358 TaxID=1246995 RepID=U5W7N1_9ACTN|nr:CU044_5270 family protein [Actinoplanes friuliensis]AGZ45124.1 hypothetical protein AFR_34330 [Actinoplanes friuliensis DSM 7358]
MIDEDLQTLYPEVPLDTASLQRAREQVFATVTPRRRRWQPGLAILATAAAVTAVAFVALRPETTPAAPGAMVEVAQILQTAADAEIRTVDPRIPAGQFRYLSTHALSMTYTDAGSQHFAVREGRKIEVWVPADHHDEWAMRESDTGERTWLVGTEAQARKIGAGSPQRPPTDLRGKCGIWYPQQGKNPCTQSGNWQEPTDTFIEKLPRDPGKLLDRLRRDTQGKGNDPDQEVLVYVADALRSARLPADVRAALYRSLALLPDLVITERTATLDGRKGTAFGITAAGQTREIIIDPRTGDFVGERTRLAQKMDRIAAGTVIESSSITYGISRKAGAPPN